MAAVEADDRLELPGNKELNEMCDHINQKHRVKHFYFIFFPFIFESKVKV
jgi:hypothetical protein